MLDKDILYEALNKKGITQTALAEQLEVNKATVSTTLRRDNIGLDTFVKYMNTMGFSVYAGEKKGGKFVPEWEITPGNTDRRADRSKKQEK